MNQADALLAYQKYVRTNPADAEGARKSFYDTFGVDPNQPKSDFQRIAARRKADIGVQQTAAGYEQDIANAKATFAGDIAKTIPVAATLATGGLAAPLAIGVMAGAGAVSGAYGEAANLALGATDTSGYSGLTGLGKKNAPSGGVVDSPKQLARRLGVDMALGAGTQGAAEFGSVLLSAAGKSVLQPLVARAAAKVDRGKAILGEYGGRLMNQLRSADAAAGTQRINIQPEMNDLEASMALIKSGPSDAFKTLWGKASGGQGVLATTEKEGGLAQKIHIWAATDGSVSGLAEIKGTLSQSAFKRAGLGHEEKTALQTFAAKIDQKVGNEFNKIGAKETYDGYKETINQLHRFNVGTEVAGLALRHMAWRAGYLVAGAGAIGGGGYGYQHGGVGGALTGAVAGAATITAASAIMQKGAPLLLEKMLADKTAAPMARQAIASMTNGNTKEAVAIMSRAAAQVGVKDILGSYFKDQAEEVPSAAQVGP